MSDAATLYKTSAMLSEEPSIETLLRGLRGLRTYLARALRALELGKNDAKIVAVTRASELLSFLQGLTMAEGETSLGAVLSGLYTAFNLRLTQAHAQNDPEGFRALSEQIALLEKELMTLAEQR